MVDEEDGGAYKYICYVFICEGRCVVDGIQGLLDRVVVVVVVFAHLFADRFLLEVGIGLDEEKRHCVSTLVFALSGFVDEEERKRVGFLLDVVYRTPFLLVCRFLRPILWRGRRRRLRLGFPVVFSKAMRRCVLEGTFVLMVLQAGRPLVDCWVDLLQVRGEWWLRMWVAGY